MTGRTTNVLMAGVGGQGVLVASEVLALAALSEGFDAKQSEVHGVAQRGGSVVSHVRFGPRVHSPLIRSGEVHVLYAGERLESLRYAHMLERGGTIVVDDRALRPVRMPDAPEAEYPERIPEFLRGKGYSVLAVGALAEAVSLGDPRCANVVLLGVLSTRLPLREESWREALERRLAPKILDLNLRAFAAGRRLAVPSETLLGTGIPGAVEREAP